MKNGLGLSGVDLSRRSTDTLDGAPWPVRAVAIIGGMTCIACFLVWFLATTVTSALGELRQGVAPLAQHVQSQEQLGRTLEKLELDHRDSNRRLERLLEVMCWQQARNDSQRASCLETR